MNDQLLWYTYHNNSRRFDVRPVSFSALYNGSPEKESVVIKLLTQVLIFALRENDLALEVIRGDPNERFLHFPVLRRMSDGVLFQLKTKSS